MRALFILLMLLFAAIGFLSLARSVERMALGEFSAQTVLQLGLGVLFLFAALKTRRRAFPKGGGQRDT